MESLAPLHRQENTGRATSQRRWLLSTRRWLSRVSNAISEGLFGYDFFISYAHDDGKAYAEALTKALEGNPYDFDAHIDSRDYNVGDDLGVLTKARVRNSSSLVVIARKHALHDSEWVWREVIEFERQGKKPIIVDVGDAIADSTPKPQRLSQWIFERSEILRQPDPECDSKDRTPGQGVVDRIVASFNGTRRRELRERIIAGALVCFVLVSAIAGWQAYSASVERAGALSQLRISLGVNAELLSQRPFQATTALQAALRSVEKHAGKSSHAPLEGYRGLNAAINAVVNGIILNSDNAKFLDGRFSMDGRWLMMLQIPNIVHVFDARTGARTSLFEIPSSKVRQLEFSPNGQELVSLAEGSNKLRIFSLDGIEKVPIEVTKHRVLEHFSFGGSKPYIIAWGNGPPIIESQSELYSLVAPNPRWGPYVFDWRSHKIEHIFHNLRGLSWSYSGSTTLISVAGESKSLTRALIDFNPTGGARYTYRPKILAEYSDDPREEEGSTSIYSLSPNDFNGQNAFSRDGHKVLLGGLGGDLTLLDVASTNEDWSKVHNKDAVIYAAWSPDQKKIAVGYLNDSYAIVSARNGEQVIAGESVSVPSWHPSSRKLFIVHRGEAAYIDAASGRKLEPWRIPEDLLEAFISSDHSRFVTINNSGQARLHFSDFKSRRIAAYDDVVEKLRAKVDGSSEITVERLIDTESGPQIVANVASGEAILFDPITETVTAKFKYLESKCDRFRFSNDFIVDSGRRLFCSNGNGKLMRLDAIDPSKSWEIQIPQPEGQEESASRQFELMIRDAQDHSEHQNYLYDMRDTVSRAEERERLAAKAEATFVTSIDMAPSGQFLVAGTSKGEILQVNARSGSIMQSIQLLDGKIFSLRLMKDVRRLVAVGESKDLFVLDVEDGSTRRISGHQRPVQSVVLSPDKEAIITAGEDGEIWEFDGRNECRGGFGQFGLLGGSTECAGVSMDGGRVASLGGRFGLLAMSPDGERVASLGEDRVLRVLDLDSGTAHYSVALQKEGFHSLVWSEHSDEVFVMSRHGMSRFRVDLERLVDEAETGLSILTGLDSGPQHNN